MRYFVTGASGWIGSAVTTELLAAGHEVLGLARSEASAATIESLGATAQRGSLDDVAGLRRAAESTDGVIHMAYIHDFPQMAAAADADRAAIAAMGEALTGSDRPLVIASGVVGLSAGRPATERDDATSGHPRIANARLALSLAQRGVRSSVVRFPPTVHGVGDHGFIATLVAAARTQGSSGYVGDGSSRWSAVHRGDAARAVRLTVERASAGSVIHAVAEEGVPTKVIAERIGTHLGVPVISVPSEDALAHFGWIGMFFGTDASASSDITRQLLDWTPEGATLVEDLDEGSYFVA